MWCISPCFLRTVNMKIVSICLQCFLSTSSMASIQKELLDVLACLDKCDAAACVALREWAEACRKKNDWRLMTAFIEKSPQLNELYDLWKLTSNELESETGLNLFAQLTDVVIQILTYFRTSSSSNFSSQGGLNKIILGEDQNGILGAQFRLLSSGGVRQLIAFDLLIELAGHSYYSHHLLPGFNWGAQMKLLESQAVHKGKHLSRKKLLALGASLLKRCAEEPLLAEEWLRREPDLLQCFVKCVDTEVFLASPQGGGLQTSNLPELLSLLHGFQAVVELPGVSRLSKLFVLGRASVAKLAKALSFDSQEIQRATAGLLTSLLSGPVYGGQEVDSLHEILLGFPKPLLPPHLSVISAVLEGRPQVWGSYANGLMLSLGVPDSKKKDEKEEERLLKAAEQIVLLYRCAPPLSLSPLLVPPCVRKAELTHTVCFAPNLTVQDAGFDVLLSILRRIKKEKKEEKNEKLLAELPNLLPELSSLVNSRSKIFEMLKNVQKDQKDEENSLKISIFQKWCEVFIIYANCMPTAFASCKMEWSKIFIDFDNLKIFENLEFFGKNDVLKSILDFLEAIFPTPQARMSKGQILFLEKLLKLKYLNEIKKEKMENGEENQEILEKVDFLIFSFLGNSPFFCSKSEVEFWIFSIFSEKNQNFSEFSEKISIFSRLIEEVSKGAGSLLSPLVLEKKIGMTTLMAFKKLEKIEKIEKYKEEKEEKNEENPKKKQKIEKNSEKLFLEESVEIVISAISASNPDFIESFENYFPAQKIFLKNFKKSIKFLKKKMESSLIFPEILKQIIFLQEEDEEASFQNFLNFFKIEKNSFLKKFQEEKVILGKNCLFSKIKKINFLGDLCEFFEENNAQKVAEIFWKKIEEIEFSERMLKICHFFYKFASSEQKEKISKKILEKSEFFSEISAENFSFLKFFFKNLNVNSSIIAQVKENLENYSSFFFLFSLNFLLKNDEKVEKIEKKRKKIAKIMNQALSLEVDLDLLEFFSAPFSSFFSEISIFFDKNDFSLKNEELLCFMAVQNPEILTTIAEKIGKNEISKKKIEKLMSFFSESEEKKNYKNTEKIDFSSYFQKMEKIESFKDFSKLIDEISEKINFDEVEEKNFEKICCFGKNILKIEEGPQKKENLEKNVLDFFEFSEFYRKKSFFHDLLIREFYFHLTAQELGVSESEKVEKKSENSEKNPEKSKNVFFSEANLPPLPTWVPSKIHRIPWLGQENVKIENFDIFLKKNEAKNQEKNLKIENLDVPFLLSQLSGQVKRGGIKDFKFFVFGGNLGICFLGLAQKCEISRKLSEEILFYFFELLHEEVEKKSEDERWSFKELPQIFAFLSLLKASVQNVEKPVPFLTAVTWGSIAQSLLRPWSPEFPVLTHQLLSRPQLDPLRLFGWISLLFSSDTSPENVQGQRLWVLEILEKGMRGGDQGSRMMVDTKRAVDDCMCLASAPYASKGVRRRCIHILYLYLRSFKGTPSKLTSCVKKYGVLNWVRNMLKNREVEEESRERLVGIFEFIVESMDMRLVADPPSFEVLSFLLEFAGLFSREKLKRLGSLLLCSQLRFEIALPLIAFLKDQGVFEEHEVPFSLVRRLASLRREGGRRLAALLAE